MPLPVQPYIRNSLMVYGSFAPGGPDHAKLSFLDGEWVPGYTRCQAADTVVDYRMCGHGGSCTTCSVVPVWYIEFGDQLPPRHTEEGGALHRDRWAVWQRIDAAFGDDMARKSHFFSEDESIKGKRWLTCYLSKKQHPVHRDSYDEPHPDQSTADLWLETVAGSKRYDPCEFAPLLWEQRRPLEELFGRLPDGEAFIARVEQIDKTPVSLEPRELEQLAKRYFEIRVRLNAGLIDGEPDATKQVIRSWESDLPADAYLDRLLETEFQYVDSLAGDDTFSYFLQETPRPTYVVDEHWIRCLPEACYSVDNSYDTQLWLMQPFEVDHSFDYTPLRQWARAGALLEVSETGQGYVALRH